MSRNSRLMICTTLLFMFSRVMAIDSVYYSVKYIIRQESSTYHNLRSDEQLQVCSKYLIALTITHRYKFSSMILKLCCFNKLII